MADVSRRTFLGAGAAAAALVPLAQVAAAAQELNPVQPGEDQLGMAAWIRAAGAPDQPLTYRGEQLRQIAFPLGGLGTGYVALGGRGQLCEWQVFNNVNKRAALPLTGFALRATRGEERFAKLLQLDPFGDLPAVADLSFRGDYPFAWLDYHDEALPIDVRLEAWNPLIPLNEADSGVPGAVFTFELTNRGATPVEVSLLATLLNAVGWNGYTRLDGPRYAGFGGNTARSVRDGDLTLLEAGLPPAEGARFARPVRLFSLDGDDETRVIEGLSKGGPGQNNALPRPTDLAAGYDVIWLDRLPDQPNPALLLGLLAGVKEGATLLVTGGDGGLLQLAAAGRKLLAAGDPARAETMLADFESGTYEGWTITGEAFGAAPATGTLPNQQAVSGFRGRRLVNTFLRGDVTTGRAVSRPFTIERRYLHFLIGGGAHAGQTCLNLVVGGQVVRTATGRDLERLDPHTWDLADLRGQIAHLEIVDTATGGWGHVNVDQIVASDQPATGLSPEVAQALADLLPYTFDDALPAAGEVRPQATTAATPTLRAGQPLAGTLRLTTANVKPGAQVLATAPDGTPLLAEIRHGRGRVLVYAGTVDRGSPRWTTGGRHLGELLALAAGTTYTPGTGLGARHPFRGSLALATTAAGASANAGFTDLAALWADFTADGRLDEVAGSPPTPEGETRAVALCAPVTVPPGETRTVRFLLGWHFPNHYRRFWGPPYEIRLGNAYTTRHADAGAVVRYLHREGPRLERETRRFHDTFHDSTLPWWLLDAVTSQAAIVRTMTCLWDESDWFGGFEGCSATAGCCPMNCTHVWNYAQSVAALFPGLERRVRREDFGPQLHDNGVIGFRHQHPHSGRPFSSEATDGQCGSILKVYREHLRSGDDTFLKGIWPGVVKALTWLLEQRDSNGDGILDGSQHHTYDVNMTGTSPFIQTLWLAALRAAERLARVVGDHALADRCRDTFERAAPALDRLLFDGEYYRQVYNEQGDTRYQHGPGCLADQVVGQWWAHQLDLGHLLPREHVRSAIRAVFHHNLRASFQGFQQRPRRFAFDDEKGLLCCTWPKGGRPPVHILYADEVWTGVEYQVAAHLIYEGFLTEGLAVAKAARERYRGHNRNPWNEIECGDNYARAMSSWSLLLAAQGFLYDGPAGRLGFLPRLTPDDHRSFYSTAAGWGLYTTRRDGPTRHHALRLDWGELRLRELLLPPAATARVALDGQAVEATLAAAGDRLGVRLARELLLTAGQTLTVTCG